MDRSSKARLSLGLGIFGVAMNLVSLALMIKRVEPFYSWFYSFAWWGYILAIDATVFRLGGASLLMDRTREFFRLAPLSVVFWLIFELFNLRIENWRYINLPPETYLRWPGYFLAYATVLPGLFETKNLVETLGIFKEKALESRPGPKGWQGWFYLLGGLFFILPLIWPRYFFPLVWGIFIFGLEPINRRLGLFSLMGEWIDTGVLKTFYELLLAGFICGGLWEFWNYFAGAKWIYTVPFVGRLKLFEMPILGYLGFPPFAVECWVMYSLVSYLWGGDTFFHRGASSGRLGPGSALIFSAFVIAFCVLGFYLIDTHTVIGFAR